MDIDWWAFVGVVAVAYAIPGPDFAVILRSATRGLRPGAAAALGAQAGLCVHMMLAVAGLSVVLARHPEALTVIRVLGGAYLLYLGGRLVLPTLRRSRPETPSSPSEMSARSAFGQGLFTNLLNPKAVLFFAAVLPQFVVPGSAPVWVQVAALGVVDVLLGVVAWAVVVLLGVRLSAALRRDRVRRWWDRVTGTVLAGVGGGLVASRG
ncbi:LysE family translocator [Actinotalea sp. C106]|uniref:LysE family translocator n=1 Tax=Actinotalea sp. C106 TaxID=2908644 RepID=UPI00202811EE|nr:LysE family translocator [Actinotalea sp. C106]